MSEFETPSRTVAQNSTPSRAKTPPIPESVTPRPATPKAAPLDETAADVPVAQRASCTVSETWQDTERFAREHPLGVSLGALAAGLVVGLLVGLAIGGE
jgi:hypothetical protein